MEGEATHGSGSPTANSRASFAINKLSVSLNKPRLTAIKPSGQTHFSVVLPSGVPTQNEGASIEMPSSSAKPNLMFMF